MDKLTLKGTVELILKDGSGRIKKQEKIDNLIVNVGKEQIARRLIDNASRAPIGNISLGNGDTAVSPVLVTDTALAAETHSAAATVSYEADFKALARNTFTFVAPFILTEAGLFSSATPKVMYSRILIGYSVLPNDTLTVNWRIQVA